MIGHAAIPWHYLLKNRNIEMYNTEIQNLKGDFTLEVEVSNVAREELLSVKHQKHQQVPGKYKHRRGVTMDDVSEKTELPVGLILGTSEYVKIKKAQKHAWENHRESVAE